MNISPYVPYPTLYMFVLSLSMPVVELGRKKVGGRKRKKEEEEENYSLKPELAADEAEDEKVT